MKRSEYKRSYKFEPYASHRWAGEVIQALAQIFVKSFMFIDSPIYIYIYATQI